MLSLSATVIRIRFLDRTMQRDKTKDHPPVQHRIQQLNFNTVVRRSLHQLLCRALPPLRQKTADYQLPCRAVQSADHLVLTQPPTSMIVEMTATNMTPSRTVYSTSAAPFSSSLSFLISCDA